VRYQQGIDTVKLMEPLAVYNEEVTGPEHALIIANRACRAALGDRGVAHLAISKDVQMMKLSADKRSMRNPGARTSSSWSPPLSVPPQDQLRAAAAVLNVGSRVAILAGQGALSAREELTQLADVLGAPVAKALLGKAVLPDDSPFTTGGIGDLGTAPSSWAMGNCDIVLILGSTMPWEEYYPRPGQARGVQVDLKPDRLGLRYPVEIGVVGDVKATLQGLLPLLQQQRDRAFLSEAQRRMADWNQLLDQIENTARSPLRPQMVVRTVSDLLSDDAVISLDCGANTHFAARGLRLRAPSAAHRHGYAGEHGPRIAIRHRREACLSRSPVHRHRGRRRFCNADGELTTAVANNLPVKIIVFKNNSLAEVKFEQQEIGNPEYGCALPPIDFVALAKACGADGFRCDRAENVRSAVAATLESSRTAVLEVVVDADEKPAKPDELRA
jgi:pyruvate dehydrogenase (quinone)